MRISSNDAMFFLETLHSPMLPQFCVHQYYDYEKEKTLKKIKNDEEKYNRFKKIMTSRLNLVEDEKLIMLLMLRYMDHRVFSVEEIAMMMDMKKGEVIMDLQRAENKMCRTLCQ